MKTMIETPIYVPSKTIIIAARQMGKTNMVREALWDAMREKVINTITVVSMLAITSAVTATTLHAADPAKMTPRTLTAKEASIEAQRQVRELAERLRESDRRASQSSSGNAAGKR